MTPSISSHQVILLSIVQNRKEKNKKMFGKSSLFVLLGCLYAAQAEVVLECKDNGNLLQPYPGDCTRFIECTNQGVEVHECPAGLHFNQGYMVCDYPESADCREGTPEETQPPPAQTTELPPPQTTSVPLPETTPVPELTTSSQTEQFDCPIDADLSFRPHPTNCNQFYQCYGGESHIFTCQEGLVFNPAEQVCDYPENVECVGGTVAPNPPPTPQAPETTPDSVPEPETTPSEEVNTTPSGDTEQFDCPIDADLSFRPHPTICNQFYQCYGGESYIFTCQEGLVFNPAEQVCDYPENVDCIGGTVAPNPPPTPQAPETTQDSVPEPETTPSEEVNTTPSGDTEQFDCPIDADLSFRPHPTNCNQFYQCYGGESYILTCQEGLHFNPAEQVCDYPENVGCVGGTVPPAAPSGAPTEAPPAGTPSNPDLVGCRWDSDQLYHSVPTNCNQFYQCSEGHMFIFNCQPGLQFSYESQACDYPENVNCVNA